MGYNISFLFQNDKNFEVGCQQFLKSYPKIDHQFVKMIKDDRASWFNLMLNVRNNVIEHATGKEKSLLEQLEQNMTLEAVEKILTTAGEQSKIFLSFLRLIKQILNMVILSLSCQNISRIKITSTDLAGHLACQAC